MYYNKWQETKFSLCANNLNFLPRIKYRLSTGLSISIVNTSAMKEIRMENIYKNGTN